MKNILYILFLAALLGSCVYEDNDTYINPIKPPDLSGASINLNEVNGSIEIHKPTMFSFTVNPSGKGEYHAVILVGAYSQELYPSSTGLFYFSVDPALVGEGTKRLQIQVAYPSRSPSLAGQLGAEIVTLGQEWNLIVNTTAPAQSAAPLVYLEDGKSMLQWNSPTSDTFLEMIILRRYLNEAGNPIHTDSIKVQDRNATIFHDASYVGGKVSYRIDFKGYKYYVQGVETLFSVNPLSFSLDSLAAAPVVSWKKSPLYNNDISIVFGNTYPISAEGNRTLYQLDFAFQTSETLLLVANNPPASNTHSPYRKEIYVPLYHGVKIDQFYSIVYLPSEDVYLATGDNQVLRKIDASTLQTVASLDLPTGGLLISSPNGKYFCLRTENNLYEVKPTGPMSVEKIDIQSLTGNQNNVISGTPSLSDNNTLAFCVNYWTSPKEFVFDLNSSEVLWTKSYTTFPILSAAGDYMYASNKIYKKEGTGWTELDGLLPESEYTPKAMFYDNGSENRLYFAGYPLKVYEVEGMSDPDGNRIPSQSLTYNGAWIDHHSDTFCGVDNLNSYVGTAYIHDLLDESKLLRTQTVREPEKMVYLNGHFFHRNGFYLP